jgi:hypothetical protein
MTDTPVSEEPEAETTSSTIPGVVEITTKPVTAEGLKTTEDNWDDQVAFTTVSVDDGQGGQVEVVYVRQTSYTSPDIDGNPVEHIRYEVYDGKRLNWVQYVISDWLVQVPEGVFEAMDENTLGQIYDIPTDPQTQSQVADSAASSESESSLDDGNG